MVVNINVPISGQYISLQIKCKQMYYDQIWSSIVDFQYGTKTDECRDAAPPDWCLIESLHLGEFSLTNIQK